MSCCTKSPRQSGLRGKLRQLKLFFDLSLKITNTYFLNRVTKYLKRDKPHITLHHHPLTLIHHHQITIIIHLHPLHIILHNPTTMVTTVTIITAITTTTITVTAVVAAIVAVMATKIRKITKAKAVITQPSVIATSLTTCILVMPDQILQQNILNIMDKVTTAPAQKLIIPMAAL